MKNLIIFGSAVTGSFRYGENEPSDIDVLSDGTIEEVKELVNKWSMKKFGKTLPIDLHKITNNEGRIEVPTLSIENPSFVILKGGENVIPHIRDDGFASILRICGNNPNKLLFKLKDVQHLSLLPPQYTYYSVLDNMDKYYSGLKAFRNAVAHCKDIDNIFQKLNCGKILKRLVTEDPVNWISSSDIDGCSKLVYTGTGWSYAATLLISTDLSINPIMGMDEKTAYNVIFEAN